MGKLKKKEDSKSGYVISQAVKSRITTNQRKDKKEASSFCTVDGLSGVFFRKRAFDEFNRKTRRRRRRTIEECSRMLIVGTDYTKTHKPKKEKLKRKENEHTKQT